MADGRTALTSIGARAEQACSGSKAFPRLFEPFKLRGLTLPNRVVMAPMSTQLGSRDGQITDELIAFYKARAVGGVGLIVVEFCCVEPASGRSEPRQLAINSATHIAGHRRLVDVIHAAGSVACLQLQHGGQGARRDSIEDDLPLAPSDMFSRRDAARRVARAMTEVEIERIIGRFGEAAAAGIEAGYDAVELHGAHGYLLTSFLSPMTNFRDDAWGGDEQRRLEFPRRVIAAVRGAIGDRPLIYRLSADEFSPKGLSVEDMARIAPALVAAGADALHVSLGLGWTGIENVIEPSSAPEGWRLPYSRRIKQAVDVPIITVGQIRWPERAEAAIANGDCDLVALGRPLLADPEWAVKAAAGRVGEIRPCTSCNYCVSMSTVPDGHIGCAENPRAGRELDKPLGDGTRRRDRAVVVGAGPGGMAAALLLDQAGFETELIEARASLGGGLVASAAPPHKDKLAWYHAYLERQMTASRVRVTTGERADAAMIAARRPDIVFIACGRFSEPLAIPGGDSPLVHDAYQLLMGAGTWLDSIGPGTILVYGGGETGCETAEYLTARGRDVLLVSRSPTSVLARAAEPIYRSVLLRRLKADSRLRILGDTSLTRIAADHVVLCGPEGVESRIAVAAVVVAQGRIADTRLADDLAARGIKATLIGDARTAGRIGDAVRDAYEAALDLAPPVRGTAVSSQVAC